MYNEQRILNGLVEELREESKAVTNALAFGERYYLQVKVFLPKFSPSYLPPAFYSLSLSLSLSADVTQKTVTLATHSEEPVTVSNSPSEHTPFLPLSSSHNWSLYVSHIH